MMYRVRSLDQTYVEFGMTLAFYSVRQSFRRIFYYVLGRYISIGVPSNFIRICFIVFGASNQSSILVKLRSLHAPRSIPTNKKYACVLYSAHTRSRTPRNDITRGSWACQYFFRHCVTVITSTPYLVIRRACLDNLRGPWCTSPPGGVEGVRALIRSTYPYYYYHRLLRIPRPKANRQTIPSFPPPLPSPPLPPQNCALARVS